MSSNDKERHQKYMELIRTWLMLLAVNVVFSFVALLVTTPKPGWEIYRFFLAPLTVTVLCGAFAVYIHFAYPKDKL